MVTEWKLVLKRFLFDLFGSQHPAWSPSVSYFDHFLIQFLLTVECKPLHPALVSMCQRKVTVKKHDEYEKTAHLFLFFSKSMNTGFPFVLYTLVFVWYFKENLKNVKSNTALHYRCHQSTSVLFFLGIRLISANLKTLRNGRYILLSMKRALVKGSVAALLSTTLHEDHRRILTNLLTSTPYRWFRSTWQSWRLKSRSTYIQVTGSYAWIILVLFQ